MASRKGAAAAVEGDGEGEGTRGIDVVMLFVSVCRCQARAKLRVVGWRMRNILEDAAAEEEQEEEEEEIWHNFFSRCSCFFRSVEKREAGRLLVAEDDKDKTAAKFSTPSCKTLRMRLASVLLARTSIIYFLGGGVFAVGGSGKERETRMGKGGEDEEK
jgi:hypothetical protein